MKKILLALLTSVLLSTTYAEEVINHPVYYRIAPRAVDITRVGSQEFRHNSLVTEDKLLDTVDLFAGKYLYSFTNAHPVLMAFRLEDEKITTDNIYGGMPLLPGTNSILYVSDTLFDILPSGLYRGQYHAHILPIDPGAPVDPQWGIPGADTNNPVNVPIYATFIAGAIPTNSITSPTDYNFVPLGISDTKTVIDEFQRINHSGVVENNVNAGDLGSVFYFGGLLNFVNPTTNIYWIYFRTGKDYEAKMTIPLSNIIEPPATGATYGRRYDTEDSIYKWEDIALSVDYLNAVNIFATNGTVANFDIDADSAGFYLSMASIYSTCTNAPARYNDVEVSLYIHPSRLGEFAHYRGKMSFANEELTEEATTGTNIIYVANSEGYDINQLLVLDSPNLHNRRSINRVRDIGTGWIQLENIATTNFPVGTIVSSGNQFGQLMYYDVSQQNKIWGQMSFTNEPMTRFRITTVVVQ